MTQFSPFDQFANPFAIGLQRLDADGPIQIDENIADYLGQKARLFDQCYDEVFQAEADTSKVQNEVLEIILAALATASAGSLKISDGNITCPTTGTIYQRQSEAPLALASRLVQEDLLIMRKKATGWHLVAGSLCFPSSWNLSEKMGKSLFDIHRPVPGINQTLDPLIRRIFDNLKPQLPVWRENWSFYDDDELRHDQSEAQRSHGNYGKSSSQQIYLRREFQTLHKLTNSGDILFTVKILVMPLSIIETRPEPAAIADVLLSQIDKMTPAQKRYKRLDRKDDPGIAYLRLLSMGKT